MATTGRRSGLGKAVRLREAIGSSFQGVCRLATRVIFTPIPLESERTTRALIDRYRSKMLACIAIALSLLNVAKGFEGFKCLRVVVLRRFVARWIPRGQLVENPVQTVTNAGVRLYPIEHFVGKLEKLL